MHLAVCSAELVWEGGRSRAGMCRGCSEAEIACSSEKVPVMQLS